MKAIALAAGYATRLFPLTRHRAKPLLEVAGAPILTHILERVLQLPDLSEVAVVANNRFAEAFRIWEAEFQQIVCPAVPVRVLNDGSNDESDKLGAIGDIHFALRHLELGSEDWLVVAGDNLIDFNLCPLAEAFQLRRAPLLALREVDPDSDASLYNDVVLDRDSRVIGFREKPSNSEGHHAAIALYFFPSEVATLVSRYLEAGGNRDAPGHFISWLVEQRPVYGEVYDGRCFDIGNRETLQDAQSEYQRLQGGG